ncbi:MAG: ABC transporter ATP-binding protein [Labilithrix sp.]|nr:ABC transporter ATP-binding protein [Labilithrix sp.]MCW5817833.1 ABC transporter ATP-binding protein [Labilithrix sp.]
MSTSMSANTDTNTPLVSVRGVRKALGGRMVLRGMDLTVARGERVVLVGANGCGKSTLLHVVAGVLDADAGTVQLAPDVAIGFAPEKPDLPEHLSVGEWLDAVAALKGVRAGVAPFGVDELRRRKTTALSLGQKQRVALATAWLGAPELLVLDEPTNALDATTRDDVLARIAAATALVATHDRELADRVATRIVELG